MWRASEVGFDGRIGGSHFRVQGFGVRVIPVTSLGSEGRASALIQGSGSYRDQDRTSEKVGRGADDPLEFFIPFGVESPVLDLWFRVQGLGCGVWGLGFS